MTKTKGVVALFLMTALSAPVLANPPWERGNDHGRYSDDCRGNKGKCKQSKGNYRDDGGHRTAGGPPPWAPAHGWRRKNERDDRQYAREDDYYVVERKESRAVVRDGAATVDVGIQKGTCNRKVIGTVLGGIVGGVIGNQVGKDSGHREVSTVLGAVIGGVVGNKVGSSMDKSDQQCTGQALEQAADRQTVSWADASQKGEYRVTPQRTYQTDGRYCRDFITEYQGRDGIKSEKSTACRTSDGSWQKLKR